IYYFIAPLDFEPLKKVRLEIFFLGNLTTFLLLALAWSGYFQTSDHLAAFLQPVLAVLTAMYLRMARRESGAA
ncbi:MAG: hypothetical protein QOH86_1633, partial [Sphingomonadales bacterium]|nr:hypothetical protein [Sphingomonadales bacterium]